MQQRRERILHKMNQALHGPSDGIPSASPEAHYRMSAGTKDYADLNTWIADRIDDPAYNVSLLPLISSDSDQILLEFYSTTERPRSRTPP